MKNKTKSCCNIAKKLGIILLIVCAEQIGVMLPATAQAPKQLDQLAKAGETVAEDCQHVMTIVVFGNKRTKTSVILRQMLIKEGETYCGEEWKELLVRSKYYVYNLEVFLSVDIEVIKIIDNEVAVYVHVQQQGAIYFFPRITSNAFNFSYWWTTSRDLALLDYNFGINHIDLTGHADQLDVNIQLGTLTLLSVGYEYAFLGKSKRWSIKPKILYSDHYNAPYTTQNYRAIYSGVSSSALSKTRGGSFRLGYRPKWKSSYFATVGYTNRRASDRLFALNPNYFHNGRTESNFLTLRLSYTRDTRNNSRYPLWGNYFYAGVSHIQSTELFQNEGLWNFAARFFHYNRLGGKWYMKNELLTYYTPTKYQGYILRNHVTIRKYFLRGYQRYLLEGKWTNVLRTDIKYHLHTFNVPLIKYLAEREFWVSYLDDPSTFGFYPYVFTELAYIDAYDNSLLPMLPSLVENSTYLHNSIIYTLGIGLDVVMAGDVTFSMYYTHNALSDSAFSIIVYY